MSKSLRLIASLLVGLTAGYGQDKAPPSPVLKRSVAIASIDVKIGAGSQSTGFSLSGGFGNASAQGGSSLGVIAIPNAAEFSAGLSEELVTALVDSKGFWVMDLPPAPSIAPLNPPIDSQGAVAPQYLLKAVVTDISCRQRSAGGSIGIFGGGQGQYENKVVLDARLIDPLTGLVVESIKAIGRKTSKSNIFGLTKYIGGSTYYPGTKILDLSYADFESSSLGEACRLALKDVAEKLRDKVAGRTWDARVVKIIKTSDGVDVYLDAPADCGLRPGDALELYRYGDELVDPKTNKVIGRTKPTLILTVKVASNETDTVLCRPDGALPSDFNLDDPRLFVRLRKP